jgi:hypothetical protein
MQIDRPAGLVTAARAARFLYSWLFFGVEWLSMGMECPMQQRAHSAPAPRGTRRWADPACLGAASRSCVGLGRALRQAGRRGCGLWASHGGFACGVESETLWGEGHER